MENETKENKIIKSATEESIDLITDVAKYTKDFMELYPERFNDEKNTQALMLFFTNLLLEQKKKYKTKQKEPKKESNILDNSFY